MTASKWFKFGRSSSFSDVKHFTLVLVLLSILDNTVLCNGMQRESRKLFGGYRITPSFCKATRAAKYNRGNTICMFNHECVQRGGEVVGACMDGFLFGACCQLKTEAQSHIPKGPGVVMTSYLDYPESDPDSDDYESDQQLSWHNSFKPIVTPGYTPGDKAQTTKASTEKTLEMELPGPTEGSQSELISEGLSQITNTLLDTPPKENNIIIMRPKPEAVYTHSTINHGSADTILLHSNGSEADNIARPSDFNVHISSMQTKPTVVPNTMTSTSTTPQTVSTHHPVFSKPVFKPKPKPQKVATTTEKYVPVQTVTKINELSSINSIIQMLNESTPSLSKGDGTTTPSPPETKSSPSPTATVAPVSYSSGYPSTYISTGHYVTLKPSSYPSVSVHASSTAGYATTPKPSYTATTSKPSFATTSKPSFATTSKPIYASTAKPTYSTSHKPTKYTPQPNKKPSSTIKPVSNTAKPGTGKPGTIKPFISSLKPILNSVRPKPSTSKPYVSSAKPSYTSPQPSQSTSQAIDAFNRYPTNPENFGESVTTFSYVSSTTTRKPPSTSYVFSNKPTRRPVTSQSSLIPSYDIAPDTFSSVTPTVIVLNGFQSTKAPLKEPEFVEISQEPFKKPVNQITVNNHIESTNNIFMNKPQQYDRPSSPTVVITPKPSPTTTPYPARPHKPTNSVSISSLYTTSSSDDYSDSLYSGTTNKPEMQTSPDDLINFPPVRNPMLNATGSNPSLYNTSISLSDNDLEVLHDVEFTTPTWQEDDKLNEKMNLFVNKIVGSLQGTFQELHDIVILDKKPNSTLVTKTTTSKPSKKTPATTRRPATTTKRPLKATTTKKPLKTTKKPTKLTTVARKPTTTAAPPTTTPKKPETTTKKSKPIRKATTTQATSTATDSEDVTTESAPTANDNGIDYNDKNLCGVRPLVKSGRIVGGKNARFGEWPWQVLVRESTWLGLFTKNKCGGVLITSRFVTTAAHCQPGFLASLVAVFGENDISGDLEPRRPVSRNVRRVIVHRQYDAATFENDLALLELDTPVKFDAHIVPICMPPDDAEFTGRLATVTGWGRLKYGGGVPAVLQVVQVPVIENAMCQEMFQKAGHTKIILNSFLCAGYANGQKDSCEGDSGGPLVTQRDDGRWQLAGTVSHGIKCAAPYLPGVYMRTTFYKPWLRSITGVH